jgi:hypothetical protein
MDEPTTKQFAIDYLREENRVLREQLGHRRLRLTNDQRRRLAANTVGQVHWPPKGGVLGQRAFIHSLFGIAA